MSRRSETRQRATADPAVAEARDLRRGVIRFLGLFGTGLAGYFLLTLAIKVPTPAVLESRPIVAALARTSEAIRQVTVRPYQSAIATTVAASLRLLGFEVHRHARRVESPRFSVEITDGCDALEISALYFAAILAYPANAKRKLLGLVIGLTAIAALNLLRVLSLWLIGAHCPWFFDFAHFSVWPFVFICFTVATFLGWLHGTVRVSRPGPIAA